MHTRNIEELIDFFIKQKISKDVLLQLLKIYKIDSQDFNRIVIEKIRNIDRTPILKINSLLDGKFLGEIKNSEFSMSNKFLVEKLDLDSVYRSPKYITYKSINRFLTVDELKNKTAQYFRCMDLEDSFNKSTIQYLHKSIRDYIKKLIDKCDDLDYKTICKKLGKDKNILNIYEI